MSANNRRLELTVDWLKQQCGLMKLAPNYARTLRSERDRCKPKRDKSSLPYPKKRIVSEVVFTPFHFNAYILHSNPQANGAEAHCILEIARYVFVAFNGRPDCVSLYLHGPNKYKQIAHVRFHDPPQESDGINIGIQLLIEIALLRLRGRHVLPLAAAIRQALASP